MQNNLTSSIPLVKELVAKQISQKSHIQKIESRIKNKKHQPGKQKSKLKNMQSPFGDFPKEYTKNISKVKENYAKVPDYTNSYGRSAPLNPLTISGKPISKFFY